MVNLAATVVQPNILNHPHSRLRRYWNGLIWTAAFYHSIFLPMHLAFHTTEAYVAWAVMDYFCDALFLVDILWNFALGYIEDGELVTASGKIAEHYLTGWFLIDFFASLPVDMFVWSSIRLHVALRTNRSVSCALPLPHTPHMLQEGVEGVERGEGLASGESHHQNGK